MTALHKDPSDGPESVSTTCCKIGERHKKYPWFHVKHFLNGPNEVMLAPKRAAARLVSDQESYEWIHDCVIQNKMVDYQFYPTVSWLDYYRMTINDYQ